jgi:hypothetical protein
LRKISVLYIAFMDFDIVILVNKYIINIDISLSGLNLFLNNLKCP